MQWHDLSSTISAIVVQDGRLAGGDGDEAGGSTVGSDEAEMARVSSSIRA
jgi:hypothetical protein